MTKMKKVIILDDKVYIDSSKTKSYADIWKDKSAGYNHLVRIETDAKNLFEYDDAGNSCTPTFNIDEYEYIFIHNSQMGDGMMPSNIIDLIKIQFSTKLILFSGSIPEVFLNESDNFPYRSIQRQTLTNNFSSFVKKSNLLNEWKLEILYYDYETILINKIMTMQDADISEADIFKSDEFNTLLKLKHLNATNSKYADIISCVGSKLIEKLRNL